LLRYIPSHANDLRQSSEALTLSLLRPTTADPRPDPTPNTPRMGQKSLPALCLYQAGLCGCCERSTESNPVFTGKMALPIFVSKSRVMRVETNATSAAKTRPNPAKTGLKRR
jgi:hypothetical protein